jgi:two-component system, LuxR family, sensor kinase FixL
MTPHSSLAEDDNRDNLLLMERLMSAAIAHELNQPLCAIVASAQACRRMLKATGDDNTPILGAIDQISAQAKRAGEIIHRLQELNHHRPTHHSTINLPDVVRGAIHLIAAETQQHHVQVSLSLPQDAPPVSGDAMQIEQVLVNLIRNAVEAMQQTDEADRELDISLNLLQTGTIEVAVRDTGRGLSDENIERLFGIFFSTKPQGMGIGLTVSRSIIEAHGGQLWARPAPGRGAVFYFTLTTVSPETP